MTSTALPPTPTTDWRPPPHHFQLPSTATTIPTLPLSESRTARTNTRELTNALHTLMQSPVLTLEKIAQGHLHHVYLARLANGLQVIVRLTFPIPHVQLYGDAFAAQERNFRSRLPYRIGSEAATLRYIRRNTTIPVPWVYATTAKPDNPVGAPFIIEERVPGIPLATLWDRLPLQTQEKAITALASLISQLFTLHFDSLGSLITQPSGDLKVGPMVHPASCEHGEYTHANQESGPYFSSGQYLHSLARRELAWLKSSPGRTFFRTERNRRFKSREGDAEGSYEDFVRVQEVVMKIVERLDDTFPSHMTMSKPTLRHANLSLAHILVDPKDHGRVTGVVDWEASAIVPLWSAHRIPPFLRDSADDITLDETRRARKRNLRILYERTLVAHAPHTAIVITEKSLMREHRTESVAEYTRGVRGMLEEVRKVAQRESARKMLDCVIERLGVGEVTKMEGDSPP
ncbi:hypothetical protein SISSUDRAFT_398552 [Sistotremastrum suecicum HHB10207 ss-3]|uniref:Aminoglycoside phosphotransferase domain-containing protein n=1 Tax=Sistotremastrum suecicum HHB10207 ss-3 TaxID=1314776 RepID=A0A165YT71_9AGAM|nr:hypothetical protein SISSUDRAFT_398552 [Sistotremastrum suecicum HHB10207 ss-3]